MTSPSRTFASGPPASASGLAWMAAGTLPDAPLMRPSVTSATLKPLPCSTASGGVSLCSSGMPLARGPWKRTTATKSRSSSPALKACCSASWLSKTRAGASMTCRSSGTAETLMTARPRLPVSSFSPPLGENGASAVRTTCVSPLVAGSAVHRSCPSFRPGTSACARRPRVLSAGTSACIRPASISSRSTKPGPPAAWNWFTSAWPLGYTRASSGVVAESSAKSLQSIRMPAARATATQWIRWLVEPPVASSATMALTMTRSSTIWPMGRKFAPCTRCSTVATASRVSASRSASCGCTKAEPGTCRPIASSSIWLLLAVP